MSEETKSVVALAPASNDEARQELADVQQETAVIRAIGEQVKAVAETPGVSSFLDGLGKAAATNAQISLEAEKNRHALEMERERNNAASRRRIEIIGAVLLPVILIFGGAAVFGLAWMVHAEIITKENAVTMGVILTALLGWFSSQRKKATEKSG